jgi:hypothetical protein
MNDYSDNYGVRVRRTDDLQFPFERLALHWSTAICANACSVSS